jgi:imidazolonepropionase-like amidohydrolase
MGILNSLGMRPADELHPARSGSFGISGLGVWNPGAAVAAPATIEIRDGFIDAVSADPQPSTDEFAGCIATPGLVDMHVHLPPDNALRLTPLMSLLYLSHGVTSIREAGDLDGTAIDAAKRLRGVGRFPVPRLFYCGPFVTAGSPTFRNSIVLRAPQDADDAARKVKALGATFLKSYDNLSIEMLRALDRACAREGLQIMGHVPAALSYEEALVAEVQHFFGCPRPQTLDRPALINRACDWHAVDDDRLDILADVTMKSGIANTPTIVAIKSLLAFENYSESLRSDAARLMPPLYREIVWNPAHGGLNARVSKQYLAARVREAVAKKQKLARMLFERGAPLFLGTDVGQPFTAPGVSLIEEFRLFVEAGISAPEVWRLVTQAAGQRLGVPGLGRIEAKAPADLLIFQNDPSHSVPDPAQLVAVVSSGGLYRKRDIDAAIGNFLDFYRSPVVRRLANRAATRLLAKVISRAA